jgi:hypothetical protein
MKSDCRGREPYLETERDEKDVGENYIMRSFMICTPDKLLVG